MSDYAIEVKNLSKKFNGFAAVDGVSFSVKKGEIFGFLGPNGAGKTTTIRLLCGLMDPGGGEGKVAGLDIAGQGEKIKEIIGYMSQKFSLYEDLTVAENIDFYLGIYQTKKEERERKKESIIERAGLAGKEKKLTADLATSVKQHLALGCALVHDPRIVFLDEPTAGVDPLSRKKFWELIRELSAGGLTTLVTTHYMDEAERCDRVALINRGKIIACDTPFNLKNDFVRGTLLEIECDRVMGGLEVLRKTPEVMDVTLYGLFLHALVKREEVSRQIALALAGEKISVKRMEKIIPSLEDVFVFLVEAQEKGIRNA